MPGSGKWTVEEGLLVGRGPNSYLFTDRNDFLNFHLLVEARVPSNGVNTGIYFRCFPSDSLPKGYEVQVGWSGGHPETGRLFANLPYGQLSGHNDPVSVGVGEWLKIEVEARDHRLIFKVNGMQTLDWENTKDPLKPGHIAIQAYTEGPAIEVRRVVIRELK